MKKLRVGVVGTGFIGKKHIEAISRVPFAEFAAFVEPYAPVKAAMEEMYGVKGYDTVEEMLAAEELDAVHNCTPTKLHFPIDAAVIRAGKHLYAEKPLALNAEEAAELEALLKEHPVVNAVNFNYRMNPMAREMHERITAGEAGRPLMVTGAYLQDWMMFEDDTDWRLDPVQGGASRAIADIGSHVFDLSQFVLGKKITAVNAALVRAYETRTKYEKTGGTFSREKGKLLAEIPVVNEDAANIMVRFEDGTPGLFQVSQISGGHKNDLSIRVDLSGRSYEWRQEESDLLRIGNRNAPNQIQFREAATMDPKAAAYTGLPAGHSEAWNDALYNAVHAFYKAVAAGEQPEQTPFATVAEGAWIMKIIDACLKSDAEGCWIDVATGERTR